MDMTRNVRVERFRARLLHGASFAIQKKSDVEWNVESDRCRIGFLFERFGEESYNLLVSDPRRDRPGASFLALRFIRAARDVLPERDSPENLAEVFNTSFADVLGGDFSILAQYDKLGKVFWVALMDAIALDDADPIKVKLAAWDGAWFDEWKARQ
jgi:hypothetical protein